jgi:hypothetical protein
VPPLPREEKVATPAPVPPLPREEKGAAAALLRSSATRAGRVLCCADEAALCAACDEEVHAANKLADICQVRPPPASSAPAKTDFHQ